MIMNADASHADVIIKTKLSCPRCGFLCTRLKKSEGDMTHTSCQEVDENRERITANAINNPHRHFSHSTRPHVVAKPPLYVSSCFETDFSPDPLGGPDMASFVEAEDTANDDDGVALIAGVSCNDADGKGGTVNVGGSVLPWSFWPMFGRSLRCGVQYWRQTQSVISDL